jgi:hypothetical protein
MKMKFKILWVEDQPSSISDKKEAIEEFLKENNFDPDIEMIDDIEHIETILDEKIKDDVDIIVTDNNLKDDGDDIFNGLSVIKKIGEKGVLVDVLFYSTPDFDEEDITKYHRFVEIVKDKTKILKPLKKLIKKNIRRCEDPIFLRGYILSRVVDLEIELNELFEIYFKINNISKLHFHNFLMENRNFSLFGKKAALSKIISANESILKDIVSLNKLQEIGEERNILAHSKIDSTKPNCFISMGEQKEFNRDRLKKLLKKINDALSEINSMKEKLKNNMGTPNS